ncbi:MAG: polyprenyl synthetase family protein [Candidatus Omnitrophota bacterium]|nr:polyprenyl synthetase family protein [Candidatus Omnitrophota bacterium]
MDIERYIFSKKKLIDKALDRYLPGSSVKPAIIHRAMRYAVFPGGKRIRPVFTIAAFEACGGKGNAVIPVACAIELAHCYTLVHDDLPCMDDDDYRRGKKTCHKKFGEAIALLAGDGLLTLAFEALSESGDAGLIKEIARAIGTEGVIGGQVADILGKSKDIEYINLRKTAALFEIAARSGGIIKGAGTREINALGNFGRDTGLVFQYLDDIKDNDGYAKICGRKLAKEKADKLSKEARSHLKVFGKKAGTLLELAKLIF